MRIHLSVIIALLIMSIFFAGNRDLEASVTLTEVMANEPGKYVYLEWIEVYNGGPDFADLTGWFLIEDADTNAIPDDSGIPPGKFAILSRHSISEDTSEMSFERYWGDSSGVWGDTPSEQKFPLIQVKMTLKNSEGKIMLYHQNDSISGFSWARDAGDGRSFEKQDIDGGDLLSNWAPSSATNGCTPGRGPGTVIVNSGNRFSLELDPEVVFLKSEQSTRISCSIPKDSELTLRLYDLNGQLLRTIYDKESNLPSEYIFDCRDGDGNLLRGGLYIIYGKVEGSKSQEIKKILVVAGQ